MVHENSRPFGLLGSSAVTACLMALTIGCGAQPDQSDAEADTGPRLLSASQIIIAHRGDRRSMGRQKRTWADARILANEIVRRARAGENFAALAQEYSDGGPSDGNLGNFEPDEIQPHLKDALLKLQPGEISDPVEAEGDFRILMRQDLQPMVATRHILVSWQGATRAPREVTRTKAEARTRIEECYDRLHAGETFAELVKTYSDDSTRDRGGDLGEFSRGRMAEPFTEAAFACPVGRTTEIVETEFGFHIIQRYR